jgi:hypothetical protein
MKDEWSGLRWRRVWSPGLLVQCDVQRLDPLDWELRSVDRIPRRSLVWNYASRQVGRIGPFRRSVRPRLEASRKDWADPDAACALAFVALRPTARTVQHATRRGTPPSLTSKRGCRLVTASWTSLVPATGARPVRSQASPAGADGQAPSSSRAAATARRPSARTQRPSRVCRHAPSSSRAAATARRPSARTQRPSRVCRHAPSSSRAAATAGDRTQTAAAYVAMRRVHRGWRKGGTPSKRPTKGDQGQTTNERRHAGRRSRFVSRQAL